MEQLSLKARSPLLALQLTGNLADDWQQWEQRFQLGMARSTGTMEKDEKVAILLHTVGEDALDNGDDEQMDEVLKEFESYCSPQKNVVFERYQFWSHAMADGTAVDMFVAELRQKSKDCEFGIGESDMIRDKLVFSLNNFSLRERLLREKDLTLEKAVGLCRAPEAARRRMQQAMETTHTVAESHVQASDRAPAHTEKGKFDKDRKSEKNIRERIAQMQCNDCGRTHEPLQCPAYDAVCLKDVVQPPKRGRGRPRKHPSGNVVQPPKRGSGRPRKHPSGVAESDSEEDEEEEAEFSSEDEESEDERQSSHSLSRRYSSRAKSSQSLRLTRNSAVADRKQTDILHLVVSKEEDPPEQERSSSLLQEEPEPPHIKEEQEEPEPPHIKEEQEEILQRPDEPLESEDGDEDISTHYTEVEVELEDDAEDISSRCCEVEVELESDAETSGGIHTREKPFLCKLCNKSFRLPHHLKTHQLIHTGERPFHCEHCDKSFGRSDELKRHQRVHTGEKPFHCEHCDKSFRWSTDLRNHHRIHTGEKPFHCQRCYKSFGRSRYLKLHQRVHTGEKTFPL